MGAIWSTPTPIPIPQTVEGTRSDIRQYALPNNDGRRADVNYSSWTKSELEEYKRLADKKKQPVHEQNILKTETPWGPPLAVGLSGKTQLPVSNVLNNGTSMQVSSTGAWTPTNQTGDSKSSSVTLGMQRVPCHFVATNVDVGTLLLFAAKKTANKFPDAFNTAIEAKQKKDGKYALVQSELALLKMEVAKTLRQESLKAINDTLEGAQGYMYEETNKTYQRGQLTKINPSVTGTDINNMIFKIDPTVIVGTTEYYPVRSICFDHRETLLATGGDGLRKLAYEYHILDYATADEKTLRDEIRARIQYFQSLPHNTRTNYPSIMGNGTAYRFAHQLDGTPPAIPSCQFMTTFLDIPALFERTISNVNAEYKRRQVYTEQMLQSMIQLALKYLVEDNLKNALGHFFDPATNQMLPGIIVDAKVVTVQGNSVRFEIESLTIRLENNVVVPNVTSVCRQPQRFY